MLDELSDPYRSSGIYGLFCLDGAPVDGRDARLLGLPLESDPKSWLVAGYDAHYRAAVLRHEGAAGLTLLVGEVEEAETLAATLGLSSAAPLGEVADAAFRRFGSDLPAVMIGEWSLLHRKPDGQVTLMLSAAQRDRLFYAIRAKRIAVAPNLFVLGRIAWVGDTVDEAGMLFPLGRAGVRAARGDSSMLRAVFQLEAGSSVIICPNGRVEKRSTQTLLEQPRWLGDYEDAVAQTEDVLRNIMRSRLARSRNAASMLSGGLDSSLLAWLCAEERTTDTELSALTSVAPPGSGIADEANFADLAANTLGIASRHIFPAEDANIYRPPLAVLTGGSGPILSNRHCLTHAFQIAAKQAGATLLIDGTYGEMSATARLPTGGLYRKLRTVAGRVLRDRVFPAAATIETSAFHVQLARHRLERLPEAIQAAQSVPDAPLTSPARHGLLGYVPGIEKALALPNEFYPGAVRMAHPYRDIRLLRLFAGFPIQMLAKGGADRGMARRLLLGRLPDEVRLRRRGMPASPDHLVRLQRQAPMARQRISLFRKAEIDDWLDLDWLDSTLESVSARGAANVDEANLVQLTAIAAEFMLWWRTRS